MVQSHSIGSVHRLLITHTNTSISGGIRTIFWYWYQYWNNSMQAVDQIHLFNESKFKTQSNLIYLSESNLICLACSCVCCCRTWSQWSMFYNVTLPGLFLQLPFPSPSPPAFSNLYNVTFSSYYRLLSSITSCHIAFSVQWHPKPPFLLLFIPLFSLLPFIAFFLTSFTASSLFQLPNNSQPKPALSAISLVFINLLRLFLVTF